MNKNELLLTYITLARSKGNDTYTYDEYDDSLDDVQPTRREQSKKIILDEKMKNITMNDIDRSLKTLKSITPKEPILPTPDCQVIKTIITELSRHLKTNTDSVFNLVLRCFLGILASEMGYQCYFLLPWSADFGNCILVTSYPVIKGVKGTQVKGVNLYAYTVGTGAGGITGCNYINYYLLDFLKKDGIPYKYKGYQTTVKTPLEKGMYGLLSSDYNKAKQYFKAVNDQLKHSMINFYENEAIVAANSNKYKGPNLSAISVMELHSLIEKSFRTSLHTAISRVTIRDIRDLDIFIAYVNHLHQNSNNASLILDKLQRGVAITTTSNTKKASDYNKSRYNSFKKFLYGELNYV